MPCYNFSEGQPLDRIIISITLQLLRRIQKRDMRNCRLITLFLLISFLGLMSSCARTTDPAPILDLEGNKIKQLEAGDIIVYGSYEQDGDKNNGPEPIEWEVLDVDDNRALLVSRYVLDCQPYNDYFGSITWKYCSLRKWLNSKFLKTAFTAEERVRIPTVVLSNPDNPVFGTDGGGNTRDRVFLLSVDEILEYYTFEEWNEDEQRGWRGYSQDLIIEATPYAEDAGVFVENGGSIMWTRSPSDSSFFVTVVDVGCIGASGGLGTQDYFVGVRPAIYIEF